MLRDPLAAARRAAALIPILALAGAATLTPTAGLAAEDQAAHIANIENGLTPTVQIRGRAVARHTLADEMAAHHTPSVSVAVVDHGRIVWAKAYGLADVEAKRPATTDTLYEAGSNSKPITASAAVRMAQDGRLQLDRPINDQLKSWRIPDNAFTQGHPVTVRQVLTHTAGLTVSGFRGYGPGEQIPSVVQILEGKPPANTPAVVVDQTPGSAWRYSGGGYVLLQLLLSDVEGRGFPELMQTRVLSAVGMTSSAYEQPLAQARAGESATGYLANGQPIAGRFKVYPELAPAGLWSTPADMAHWAIALERAYNGEPSPLMSQASAKDMLTPGLGKFGMGIAILSTADGITFGHGGSDLGFKSEFFGWTKGEHAMVVMANGEDAMPVVEMLVQAMAQEYGWAGLTPKIIEVAALTDDQRSQFVGGWGHASLVISAEGDRLTGHAFGRSFELVPQDADRLALATGVPIEFFTAVRGQDGRIKALIVNPETTLDRDP